MSAGWWDFSNKALGEVLSYTLIVCKAYVYLRFVNANWLVTSHEFSELFYALTIQSFTPSPAQEVFWERWIWLQVDDMFLANTGNILATHTKIKLKKHINLSQPDVPKLPGFFSNFKFFANKNLPSLSGKIPKVTSPRDSKRGGTVGYIFSPPNLHPGWTLRLAIRHHVCGAFLSRKEWFFEVRIPEKTKAQKWKFQKLRAKQGKLMETLKKNG